MKESESSTRDSDGEEADKYAAPGENPADLAKVSSQKETFDTGEAFELHSVKNTRTGEIRDTKLKQVKPPTAQSTGVNSRDRTRSKPQPET